MPWHQIEASPTHLTFLIASAFLSIFTLFSVFIRSRLHIAEPPLALLTGIIFGPHGIGAFHPEDLTGKDNFMQEFARVIAGLQVFASALELPKRYLKKNWSSVLWLLGPVMSFGWMVVAGLVVLIFKTDFTTATIISACLTPTDPVLAASILSNSLFSTRVPSRIKHLLSCESGCNDGMAYPFLYIGLSILTKATAAGAAKKFFLISILWQCGMGVIIGTAFGLGANMALRFSDSRKLIGPASFIVFYLVVAMLSIGIGSTLGLDDFLVAFSAGAAFSHDGWFAARTRQSNLNNVLDLIVNSTFFIYLGAVMPWNEFVPNKFTPQIGPGRLLIFLIAVLILRRIPAVVALKTLIPNIHTWYEAFFCGHFGPMGVGALFLAIEARAQLETGDSIPLPEPDPSNKNIGVIKLIWPVISFIVMGSTFVHGCSVVIMTIVAHFWRDKEERAGFIGAESDPLGGMVHDTSSEGEGEDEGEEEWEAEWQERRNRIHFPN